MEIVAALRGRRRGGTVAEGTGKTLGDVHPWPLLLIAGAVAIVGRVAVGAGPEI